MWVARLRGSPRPWGLPWTVQGAPILGCEGPHRRGRRVRSSLRTRRTPRILAPPAEARDTTMSMIDTKTRKPSSTFQLLRRYACSPKYRPSETTWGRGEGRGQPDSSGGWSEIRRARGRARSAWESREQWAGADTCPAAPSEGGL